MKFERGDICVARAPKREESGWEGVVLVILGSKRLSSERYGALIEYQFAIMAAGVRGIPIPRKFTQNSVLERWLKKIGKAQLD